MAAKIIKFDEYIAEIVSLNKPNILQSIMDDIRVDEETAMAIYKQMTFDQEHQMVNAHLDTTMSPEQKVAISHTILDPIYATMNKPQPFSGVDIAEGFNFRREVANEVARTNIMDWLEENSIEYLIDNTGNFAVKCADRKTHYRVNRQFEHVLNKWDRGSFGKNVDPTVHRKALSVDMKGNILSDALNEAAQDGSMPLPDMSGTPPMFPATEDGSLTDGIPDVFENTEDSAIQILGDLINPSSEIYVEILDEKKGEWLVCDDATEKSFVVDTINGQFEEVQYICEGAGSTYSHGHAPGRLGPRPDDPRGDKHDLPTKFDQGGIEIPADPVGDRTRSRVEKFLTIPFEELANAQSDDQKIDLMLQYGIIQEGIPEQYWGNFVAQFDELFLKIKSIRDKGGVAGIKEAKKKLKPAKQRDSSAAALAANRKTYGQAGAMTSKKKQSSKDACRGNVSEGVLGAATGMTGIQTLAINRLRQLAGLPDSTMTVIEIDPIVVEPKNEPIVISGDEITDMDDALNHLSEVFNIYKTLNTIDKSELRLSLINSIMGDGAHLSESVIDLLLDDKPSILLEFNGDNQLSKEDKEYLVMVINDIKSTICEDIEVVDSNVSISLARVAYLLEALYNQMDESE